MVPMPTKPPFSLIRVLPLPPSWIFIVPVVLVGTVICPYIPGNCSTVAISSSPAPLERMPLAPVIWIHWLVVLPLVVTVCRSVRVSCASAGKTKQR